MKMGKGLGWCTHSWFSFDHPGELPTAPPPSPRPGPWQPSHHPLAKAIQTLCWALPRSLGGWTLFCPQSPRRHLAGGPVRWQKGSLS